MKPLALIHRCVVALLSGLVVVMALAPSSHGAAADCEATTVVASSEADAWIDANSILANKGSDAVLSIGDTSRAVVRFPVPQGVPEGCAVESARLRLYADSGTEGTRVSVQALAFAWSESLVNWSTQPSAVGPAVAAWSRDGYMQWNVTSLVPAMLEGRHHGFLLRDAAEGTENVGGHGFYAREKGENPPQLVIRFAAPPTGEPGPPEPPSPAAVKCGDVVTQSTLVTNHLTDCLGDGLLIGADRIILDLGGHTIDGVGLGTGVRNEGYESVTVRNGTVREFDHGVELLEETRRNVVERLSLHHNEVAAIELFDAGGISDGNEIRANTVDHNGGGILLVSGTKGTVVTGNTLTLNSGAALLMRDSDANRLEGNRVVGGGDLGVGLERSSGNTLLGTVVSDTSDGGIEIHGGSHGNRVEDSVVTQSGDTGILVGESDGNELIANTTIGMSDSGIALSSANDGVVRHNKLGGNPGGLQVDGSSRNLIEHNDASNGSGIGIELGGDSYANTLVRNTANGNSAQGFYVADEALLEPGNLLHRNTANDNGSDGITVAKGGHTLTANIALRNRGWGISTVGLNFTGRNMAEGNLEPGQCLGILCGLLDVTPPETTIDSGPDAITSGTAATFTFSANEVFTTFECALDDASFAPCDPPAAYAGLAEGDHELRVRATDEAGNADPSPARHAWSIDLTPPETVITSGPDAVTESTTARFTFAADEPATFECALDTADFTACESPAAYADLPDGDHELRVLATDTAGNTDPTPAGHAWRVETAPDTTAPETAIDAGPDAFTAGTTARLTFSADEPATFECALDTAEFAACDSPAEYTDLSEGEHTLRVRATDRAGNIDATAAVHAWTIDRTPPETTIDTGPDPLTSSASASFTFSADEPATLECALDTATFTACESPAAYTGLADGDHELRVRAIDRAGNADATPAVHRWTVDRTPPETTIDTGPDEFTAGTSARFTFSANESATFECALDTAEFAACDSPAAYTDLAEGEHTLRVRATDRAGNTDPSAARHTWTVDRTPPETTIDTGPDPLTSSASASFTFSADEPATFECALDLAEFAPCDAPAEYTDLADGDHELRVRAIDRAGNADATPASHRWTIDRIPPETTVDTGPDQFTTGTSARFTFSADEPATFECALDTAQFETCESPAEYTDLADGEHTLRVRATDRAGNTDRSAASHMWTVDSTPPETTIEAAPEDSEDTTARFAFSADEAAAFECALDTAEFTACSSPQQYAELSLGRHEFRVRAVDAAGNADPAPATHGWTVQAPPDTTPPDTTIDTGAAPITASGSATFTFSASEPGSTFECSLDGATFTSCTSPQAYGALADGQHQFRVRAVDSAGNADPTPASRAWTIDRVVPQTTIDSAPPLTTTGTSARLTFSSGEPGSTFECSLDGAAFARCSSPQDYAGLSVARHEFRVRAIDAAGNTDLTPASHVWTIQAVVPSCTATTLTAAASADSWVLESSPTSNYRNDSVLKVDTKAGANARALVRFALPPIPAGCVVTSATLRLYASSYKPARSLAAFRLGATWTEAAATWNTQPATASAAVIAPSGPGYREWQVASLVQAMYAGGNHGFLIRDAAEGGNGIEQAFNSREKGSDNPPQLVVSFGASLGTLAVQPTQAGTLRRFVGAR